MLRHSLTRTEARRRRLAFTLIELLVVLAIIGILISLLMAGYGRVITSARVTAVVSEIKNLEKSIRDFKLEYGIEPPSYFVFFENGAHWADSDADAAADGHPSPRRSREILRKVWPNFLGAGNFPIAGPTSIDDDGDGATDVDLNHDGDYDDVHILNGAECLVFFLGGVWTFEDGNGNSTYDAGERIFVTGFHSNSSYPFIITATLSNRTQFYDFDPARLVDVDGDLMPEFVDTIPSQTMPYQYFSSYDGAGYRPYGVNGIRNDDDDETIRVNGAIVGPEAAYYTAFLPRKSYEQQSFQIISPGFDALFFPDAQRPGGANARAPDLLTAPGFGFYDGNRAVGAEERDNITNFKGGPLN